ncbi:uncharacterized protein LOC141899986 isoform X1 [Tubulanus polymorphus]|uniref:uncharacterized protein LOC141899986 isoform X1 n=1 Tax=Tubulanus polymorphus TaxID=672921 RepID=UPI003DA3DDED
MRSGEETANICLTGLFVILLCVSEANGIGCYVCTSINHSDPQCEDTFNSTKRSYYQSECWAGRKNRAGLFPATQCIKLKASIGENYTIMSRRCVVDDGGTTSETEIGRESHCGWIRELRLNDQDMRGCVLACASDGCNTATSLGFSSRILSSSILFLILTWITFS